MVHRRSFCGNAVRFRRVKDRVRFPCVGDISQASAPTGWRRDGSLGRILRWADTRGVWRMGHLTVGQPASNSGGLMARRSAKAEKTWFNSMPGAAGNQSGLCYDKIRLGSAPEVIAIWPPFSKTPYGMLLLTAVKVTKSLLNCGLFRLASGRRCYLTRKLDALSVH